MDPRPDIHLGHEMTPTTHTGPIPAVSASADAGQRDSSARTTAAVIAVKDGEIRTLIRRETEEDLLGLDVG